MSDLVVFGGLVWWAWCMVSVVAGVDLLGGIPFLQLNEDYVKKLDRMAFLVSVLSSLIDQKNSVTGTCGSCPPYKDKCHEFFHYQS